MSDDDLTAEEAELLLQGFRDLGMIDALMAALQQTLLEYPDSGAPVGAPYWSKLLVDAADVTLAWQALRASGFGAMFDPRVISPDEEPPDADRP